MIIPRTLYLETPIWNQLSSEAVDADALLISLGRAGIVPVISTQVISELAASFLSKRAFDPRQLGQQLFAYLRPFVRVGIPCLKMNCQLLRDEAMTITGEVAEFAVTLSTPDYQRMTVEVQKLAQGIFEPAVQTFLQDRRRLSMASRVEAAEFGRARSSFKSLCEESFATFLKLVSPVEVLRVLRDHLREEFPGTEPGTLVQVAAALLRNPSYRVANAMVRADLYTTWRAIRTGTLSRDVLDDCYHLVNACYCDFYATKDRLQAQYAPLVFAGTEVLYCDGTIPISEWLSGIVTPQPSELRPNPCSPLSLAST